MRDGPLFPRIAQKITTGDHKKENVRLLCFFFVRAGNSAFLVNQILGSCCCGDGIILFLLACACFNATKYVNSKHQHYTVDLQREVENGYRPTPSCQCIHRSLMLHLTTIISFVCFFHVQFSCSWFKATSFG